MRFVSDYDAVRTTKFSDDGVCVRVNNVRHFGFVDMYILLKLTNSLNTTCIVFALFTKLRAGEVGVYF